MTNSIRVFKFGGASLKDGAAVRNVQQILHRFSGQPIVVVVSAMGKTTNALEKVIEAYMKKEGTAVNLLHDIRTQHYRIMDDLFKPGHEVYAKIDQAFAEVEVRLSLAPEGEYDFLYDQIIYVGELSSSIIVQAYLNETNLPTQWLDARSIIVTDDIYREGWVLWEETLANAKKNLEPLVSKGHFVLTQGFIASTKSGNTITLGREGSDYTAAILSFCLDAESMTIWKDVPGVLTADPRVFDNVVKLDHLSYREAIEMTYYGAKVIHPKTIKPLQNKSIPLYVKSFIDPSGEGTYISDEVEDLYPPMVAIESNQAVLNISTRDFSFVAEHHMRYLFSEIADQRIQVNLMQNTAISFSICVNDVDDKVDDFAKAIEKDFKVMIERGLQLISVRHYHQDVLENLKRGKIVILEERIGKTVQMVVKDVPIMTWKR
jgi:aspartate kinase